MPRKRTRRNSKSKKKNKLLLFGLVSVRAIVVAITTIAATILAIVVTMFIPSLIAELKGMFMRNAADKMLENVVPPEIEEIRKIIPSGDDVLPKPDADDFGLPKIELPKIIMPKVKLPIVGDVPIVPLPDVDGGSIGGDKGKKKERNR